MHSWSVRSMLMQPWGP
ncbi:hypothetical protein IEO21_10065 [Rhodonia placenta]|uniref:Uncharacterized protein n=1 Tax=Rhodonia placenta TaxID=104341 RepID=A0A8H7TX51_9APHY|nr:hypothetical protein IEO21_10065 [Postia placenta]